MCTTILGNSKCAGKEEAGKPGGPGDGHRMSFRKIGDPFTQMTACFLRRDCSSEPYSIELLTAATLKPTRHGPDQQDHLRRVPSHRPREDKGIFHGCVRMEVHGLRARLHLV